MAVRLLGGERAPSVDVTPIIELERVSARWRRSFVPKAASSATDSIAIAIAMLLAYVLGDVASVPGQSRDNYLLFALCSIPAWLVVFARYGLYSSRRITSRTQEYRQVFHAVVVAVAVMMLAAYAIQVNVARRWLLLTFCFALAFVAADREATRRVFEALRRRGRMMRPVVIVGANGEGHAIADMLDSQPWLGYRVLGFVDDVRSSDGSRTVFGPTSMTLQTVLSTGATGVIVATTAIDADTCNDVARELVEAGVHVELSSTLRDVASQRLLVRPLGRYPVVCLQPVRRTGWRGVAKRTWDISIASFAIVVTAPLTLLVALLVKIDSAGPVLFRQSRIGKDGEVFTIFKFRTMSVDAELRLAELEAENEADGPLFKIRNDPRTTRIGRFLRRFSIDELPQLFNVLRGEMSMVGPRPALPSEAAKWAPRLRQRLRVKPGLTGMWQVNGRSNSSFEQYERLDLYYVDNWSLITDLMIILRTIPVLLRRNGAY
ncbi:MAG: putative undecaprenyl-phosphate glycosylphosphotransferase [Actinomycetia bacterium]|nr:putative undecaprenyl-phosphate glycosylphosphotransferase [Actinomycetes bacterium]